MDWRVVRCKDAKKDEPLRFFQPMEHETHAPHSARAVRAILAGWSLEHVVRLRLVRIFHGDSQSHRAAQLYRRFRDFESLEHLRFLSRLQMVCIQNQGQLPARMDTVRGSVQRRHSFRSAHLTIAGCDHSAEYAVRYPSALHSRRSSHGVYGCV